MADFLVGGYTSESGGTAEGIGVVRTLSGGGLAWVGTVARVPSPSWLAFHDGIVHAALEETAEVASFALEQTRLRPLSRHPTAGAAPCHLQVTSDALVVACYGSGKVGVHDLDAAGAAGPLVQTLAGSGNGPLPAQAGPHAHQVLELPDRRVLTADLGADLLYLHSWVAGRLERTAAIAVPPGTGPRDLLLLPDGAVAVAGEWGCTVHLLVPDGDAYRVASEAGLAATGAAGQAAGLVSADGRHLYVGVRGSDHLVLVRRDGNDLEAVASVPCGGDCPRSVLLHGHLLYVANQRSNTVTTFATGADGRLSPVGEPLTVPSPTCLLPVEGRITPA